MRNPVVRRVNGTLTCDAFPRERGRYEVVCSYVRDGEVTFASHGTFPGKEAAEYRIKEVTKWMKARNPLEPWVCYYCGAKIYATITPVKCPKCRRPWKMRNPTLKEKLASASMLVWYYCRKCKRKHYKGSRIFKEHLSKNPSRKLRLNPGTNWHVDRAKELHLRMVQEDLTPDEYKTTAARKDENFIAAEESRKRGMNPRKRNPKFTIVKDSAGSEYGIIPFGTKGIVVGRIDEKPLTYVTQYYPGLGTAKIENPRRRNPYAYYVVDKWGRTKLVVKKKNPRSMVEWVGNMLGGMGLLAIPVVVGLIYWVYKKQR